MSAAALAYTRRLKSLVKSTVNLEKKKFNTFFNFGLHSIDCIFKEIKNLSQFKFYQTRINFNGVTIYIKSKYKLFYKS